MATTPIGGIRYYQAFMDKASKISALRTAANRILRVLTLAGGQTAGTAELKALRNRISALKEETDVKNDAELMGLLDSISGKIAPSVALPPSPPPSLGATTPPIPEEAKPTIMRMVDPAVLAVATPPAATTAPMAAAPKRIMASPGASFTLSEIAAAVDTSVVVAKFNQLQDTIRTALETRQAYRESLASISIDIGRLIDHLINEGRRLAFALRDVETNYKLELATDADIARATREIGELETRIPELEREDPNNSRIGILRSDLAAKQATLKALENPVEQRYQLERERSISTHGTQTAQLKKQVGLLKQQQQSRVSGISQESDRIAEALAERHQVVQILGTIQSRIAVQQEGLQAEREAITEALTGQPQRVAPRGLFGPVHDLSDQDVVALTMAVDSGEIVSIIDTIFETSPVIESFTALGEYLRDPNSSLNIEAIRTFIAGLAGDQAQFREILGRAIAGDPATKVQAFAAITEPLEAALVGYSNIVAGGLLTELGDPPIQA